MAIYQYLFVVWVHSTNWNEIANKHPRPQATWNKTFYIWRPGAEEAETRSEEDVSWTQLFDELGKEGWRLVDRTIADTAIMDTAHGWREVGVPVRDVWTFLRETAP